MRLELNEKKRTISSSFLRGLILIVAVGFLLSMAFLWTLQTRMSNRSAERLLRLNIEDVRQDVVDASNANLLALTRLIAAHLEAGEGGATQMELLMKTYDVAEINVIGADGIIAFVDGAPQFDDITMLSFRYDGAAEALQKNRHDITEVYL